MIIAQITDLHIGFEPDNEDEANRHRLERVLAALRALDPAPDLLLATGDLVDRGDRPSYATLRHALTGLPFPVHFAMGNHDERTSFHAVFPETPLTDGFVHYALDLPQLRVLVLDTLEPGRHGGAFCTQRAAWLNARLDEAPDRPTLIVLHHPPFEAGIVWMDTDPTEPWVERLAGCLRGRANLIGLLCGHVHRAIVAQWEGVTTVVCPSTAPQVALDLQPIDTARADGRAMIIDDAPGFALHWWNGRQLVSHFQTAQDHPVLAIMDERLRDLAERFIAERPQR